MPDKEPVREHYGVEIPEQDRAPIRFFEGIRFRLRDKGAGAGDSTVLRRLQELQTDVASPNGGFFDAHAEEFLRCFQPVKGTLPVDTKKVPTLLDQLAPALKEFTPQQRRETLQYLVHDLSQSLVHNKQPRSEKTGRSDINERTRDTAKFVGTTLEEKILERMDPTPIPGKTDFDRFMRIPVRTGQAFGAIFLALKLGGCTPINPTITPETIRPAITQPAQITEAPTITPELIPSATPSGPETTSIAPSAYPASVSVEQVTQARTRITDAPPAITTLAEVQTIIDKHTELAHQAGLTFDHMEVEYVADIQRWYLYPADSQGNIVGWLQIEDTTSQTGWRYAEQPTWDSQFHPSQDTFRFGLPNLYGSRNHFEMVVINGFPILVEVFPNGQPQYWNNITLKQTMLVEGAVLPPDRPVVMFAHMSPEGGASQCARNSLDLNSPNFESQLAAMMASIRTQAGTPDTDVLLRVIPGTRPGSNADIYTLASFYFQSLHGNVPIVACGEAHLGNATGRIQFVDSFPFPDGSSITFGLVHEQDALEIVTFGSLFNEAIEDNIVFHALQQRRQQVTLEFYINSYYDAPPADAASYQQWVQQNIDNTGSVIVPQIFDELEAQRFSELFIEVFYDGNRSPDVLSELKALMQGQLLPGYITIDS